jgi:hypothetical protein
VRLPCVITCTLAALGWLHACSETVRADEAHDLARVCTGEAGWDRGPDCPAIHAVLTYRSQVRGTSWRSAARAYSPGHLGRRRDRRRPWIAHLHPSGRQPAGWPQALPWARYRGRWLRMLRYARRIVAGEVEHGCPEPPAHWGMRSGVDLRRARAAGWRELNCTVAGQPTRNAFWAVTPEAS